MLLLFFCFFIASCQAERQRDEMKLRLTLESGAMGTDVLGLSSASGFGLGPLGASASTTSLSASALGVGVGAAGPAAVLAEELKQQAELAALLARVGGHA